MALTQRDILVTKFFKKCNSLIISAIGKTIGNWVFEVILVLNLELLDSSRFQNSVAFAEPEAGGVVNLYCALLLI